MIQRPSLQSCNKIPNREEDSPIVDIYNRLYREYGPQHWWPGDSAVEIIIGAILTQAVAWVNVECAINNLKSENCLSIQALRDVPETALAQLLRPSGYFNAKTRKVKCFVEHVWKAYSGDLTAFLSKDVVELRQELLGIYGIGEETADDIVLYAAQKPSFVIDAYTRRIFQRLGIAPSENSYWSYQELFRTSLPTDVTIYNEYHALLDKHAKEACKREPICQTCCLLERCDTGRSRLGRSL